MSDDVFEQLTPEHEERYLVALLLTITTRNLADDALARVAPDDFASGHYQGIWKAALKLQANDTKITRRNLITVSESTGTEQVLNRLADLVPRPADYPAALAEVKRCAQLRSIVEATHRIRQRAFTAEDPSQALAHAFEELTALDNTESNVATTKGYRELLADLQAHLLADRESYKTIPTPWPDVDEQLAGGLHPGRVYVVGARTGGGKSIVGHQLAEHAASKGHPAMVFSVEMGKVEVTGRMVSNGAQIELKEIARRELSDYSWTRFDEYRARAEDYPLHVDDRAELSVPYLKAECRSRQRRSGLDLAVVDYLQLIKAERNVSREQQVAQISRSLKQLSRELNIAIVLPAQLNRRAEDRTAPTLADLRESGAIEQDADVVMLMSRGYHTEGDQVGEPNGSVTIDIAKNRHGRTGPVELLWRAHYSRIG